MYKLYQDALKWDQETGIYTRKKDSLRLTHNAGDNNVSSTQTTTRSEAVSPTETSEDKQPVRKLAPWLTSNS